jgi:hypothetical protein
MILAITQFHVLGTLACNTFPKRIIDTLQSSLEHLEALLHANDSDFVKM